MANFPLSNDPVPRISLKDRVPLPAPLVVYLEPTNICQFKCPWCPVVLPKFRDVVGREMLMNLTLFERAVQQLKGWKGVKAIRLFGFGEPLLHPNIDLMMRMATAISDRVEMTTNAVSLSSFISQSMIDSGLHYLRVSAYPTMPLWREVRDRVRILREMRDQQQKSSPFICVKVFEPSEMDWLKREYEGIADDFWCEGFHSIGSDLIPNPPATGDKVACPFPFYMLVVKVNGTVLACPIAWERSVTVGDVRKESLRAIWAGDKLRTLQRDHLAGKRACYSACVSCDTLYCCGDSVDGLTVEEFNKRIKYE